MMFGQRNKLTAEGPFLDALRTFRQELGSATTLTIIGYSFRDDHINQYIAAWFNVDSDHRIRIVNGPDFLTSPVKFAQDLASAIPSRRVEVIPLTAKEALPSLWT